MCEELRGVRTVEELFDIGCVEVRNRDGIGERFAYVLDSEVEASLCTTCYSVKLVSEFYFSSSGFCNLQSFCKLCSKRKNRQNLADNLEREKLKQHRRRAMKLALPYDLTKERLVSALERFEDSCALSGESTDIHLDHVIPLSIGHGGTIEENIIPLNASLNISKHDGNIFEWFEDNHDRLNLERSRFDSLIDYLADLNNMTTQEYRDYVDWCFDNPRKYDEDLGELVFVNY